MVDTTVQALQNIVSANTHRRELMRDAELYYRSENPAIMNRKKTLAKRDEQGSVIEVVDIYAANEKEASGYFKLLVDQKVNFSVNQKMQCDVDGTPISEIWGEKWRADLRKIAKDSAKKGYSVVQFYLKGGVVKWKQIPAEQCTPIYDDNGEYLLKMIRQYTSRKNGKEVSNIEVWTADTVSHWVNESGKEWAAVLTEVPHIVQSTVFGDHKAKEDRISWGVVPFAVLKNNDEMLSDLQMVKTKIDAYDITSSDYTNDLIEHGSPYWVVKNYQGNSLSDWNKFLEQFRVLRMVGTEDNGSVDRLQDEIPHAARAWKLERLEKEIFTFGMGVNTSSMSGSVTATEIMAAYDNLVMKASEFELHVTDFLDDFVQFLRYGVNISHELLEEGPCVITFVHSLVFDANAAAKLANESRGMISEKTRLSSDPRVSDPEEEMIAMSKEALMFGVDLQKTPTESEPVE